MNKWIIITDSCSDLSKEYREKYGIDYVKLSYSFDGRQVDADLDWPEISAPEFYNIIRNGTRIISSQATTVSYVNTFEKYAKQGYDILYIGCSSALSGSVIQSYPARDEVMAKYNNKIFCIDALISSHGQALLCVVAAELKEGGATIDEVAEWVEKNKLCVHQEGSVDKLIYLKQAGRVSATSAFFGGLLNIKPIIISDAKGANVAVEKVKGRLNSIKRAVERVMENWVDCAHQKVFIGHADCIEDAKIIEAELRKALGDKRVDIHIDYIGPAVGASVGPGMFGIYYFGIPETMNA